MSVDNFLAALEKAVAKAGSQRALAASTGVSQPHISEVLTRQAEPSEALVAAIGWTRTPVYRKARQGAAAA